MLKSLFAIIFILSIYLPSSATPSAKLLASSNYLSSHNTTLANTPTTTEQGIVTNGHEHFINLTDADKFAINNNAIYFTKLGQLYFYNLTSHTLQPVATYTQVTQIRSVGNLIVIVNNEELVVLTPNLDIVTLMQNNIPVTFSATKIYTSFSGSTTTIAILHNYTLRLIKLSSTNQVIYNQSTTLVGLDTIHSITMSLGYIYIAHQSDTNNFILQANQTNLAQQRNLPITLSNTKIEFANMYDKNILITISGSEQMLNILEIQNETTAFTISTEDHYSKTASGILTPSFLEGNVYNFKNIYIFNNKLYVLDSGFKSIQSFAISQNQETQKLILSQPTIIVASTSYSVGRFNNPKHIFTISDSNYIVSDTQNNRVQHIMQDNTIVIKDYESNDITYSLSAPKIALNDIYNNYIVYHTQDTTNEIIVLNPTQTLAVLSSYDHNLSTYPLGQIASMAITKQNVIYAIDYTNNVLLKSTQNYTTLETMSLDTPLTYSSTSKVFTLVNNQLVIYNNNTLYLFDNSGKLVFELNSVIAQDVYVDNLSNIFTLNNGLVTKYTIDSATISQAESITLSSSTNFGVLSVSTPSGSLVLLNNNTQQLTMVTNTQFSSGLTTFTHPQLVTNLHGLTQQVTLATLSANTLVYDYPNYLGNNYELQASQSVIVLDSSMYDNYTQIIYSYNGKLQQGYVLSTAIVTTETQPHEFEHNLKVINKNVRIFKYPTYYKYNNSAIILQQKTINEVLVPISQKFTSIDGTEYYAVLLENNSIGYVSSINVVFANLNTVRPLLNTNYKTLSTLTSINVYSSNSTLSQVIYELSGNYDIYVENYNENSVLTQIKFLDENNFEITGYIETIAIKQNLTSEKNLTALILVILGFTLLVASAVTYNIIIKKNKELI